MANTNGLSHLKGISSLCRRLAGGMWNVILIILCSEMPYSDCRIHYLDLKDKRFEDLLPLLLQWYRFFAGEYCISLSLPRLFNWRSLYSVDRCATRLLVYCSFSSLPQTLRNFMPKYSFKLWKNRHLRLQYLDQLSVGPSNLHVSWAYKTAITSLFVSLYPYPLFLQDLWQLDRLWVLYRKFSYYM